jgi:hypothetical protein
MDAIRSLLYPFSWPYSYVPVLPSHLIDHCESPCPFLFGVMSDNFDGVIERDLNDVRLFVFVIVNIYLSVRIFI